MNFSFGKTQVSLTNHKIRISIIIHIYIYTVCMATKPLEWQDFTQAPKRSVTCLCHHDMPWGLTVTSHGSRAAQSTHFTGVVFQGKRWQKRTNFHSPVQLKLMIRVEIHARARWYRTRVVRSFMSHECIESYMSSCIEYFYVTMHLFVDGMMASSRAHTGAKSRISVWSATAKIFRRLLLCLLRGIGHGIFNQSLSPFCHTHL